MKIKTKIIVFPFWLMTKSFRIIFGLFGFDPIKLLGNKIYTYFIYWDLKETVFSCKGDDCVADDHMEEIEGYIKRINNGEILSTLSH